MHPRRKVRRTFLGRPATPRDKEFISGPWGFVLQKMCGRLRLRLVDLSEPDYKWRFFQRSIPWRELPRSTPPERGGNESNTQGAVRVIFRGGVGGER